MFCLYHEVLYVSLILFSVFQPAYGQNTQVINVQINKRQTSTTCELPPYPKNGRWMIINGDGKPGDQVYKNTVIKFECDRNYKLSAIPFLVCDDNWSLSNIPVCEKKCPPKYSTPTTFLTCSDKFGKDVPCDEAVDGTFLTYSCIPHFEAPLGYKKTAICVGDTWNFPNPICQPVCGKKIDKDTLTLIGGGTVKDHREYPWIIAIYQKSLGDLTVCGGSLVNQNIVITAAHCVTNEYGNALPSKDFAVAAGKYYNKFKDPRDDKNVQYVDVDRVLVHSAYRGASKLYIADIALVVTKQLIVFSNAVQPVCYQDLPSIHIHPGKIGVVAGFGKTETGEQPDELRTLEIPYKYEASCAQELPMEWADKFYTNDKICAGFLNQNKSACPGDSGSGLYFKNPDDQRYYIHGVVSLGPAIEGQCNIQQNSLYTKVANYYEFIDREITKENVEQCSLPMHPKNGKWSIVGQNKNPGDIVPSNTVLKIECNAAYELSSATSFTDCASGRNLPECELPCPKPVFPKGTTYKCTSNKGDQIDCSKSIDGTILIHSCPAKYKIPVNGNNVHFCKKGSWGGKPECVPYSSNSVTNTNINSTAVGARYVVCTYASWYATEGVLPENFNSTLCTHIIYAYVGIWDNGEVRVQNLDLELDGTEKGLYKRVTDMKANNTNLKVLLAVGGTSASNTSLLSSMAGNKNKKSSFIYSILYFVEQYNFDGLDLDWNYPEVKDKTNYLNLLQDLREKCDERGYLLTATVRSFPEDTGYSAKQLTELLDFVNVKTHDFYGPWSSYTGQNSPLYASSVENFWEKGHLNMKETANNWVKFGVPKSKMVLSIALFSWVLILSDKAEHGLHAPIKNSQVDNGFEMLRYSQICSDEKWISTWDDEQKSVYSYHEDKWIGHENSNSVLIKASYIKDNGFLGVNVWPIDGDDVHGNCGTKQNLLKQINRGLRDSIK